MKVSTVVNKELDDLRGGTRCEFENTAATPKE